MRTMTSKSQIRIRSKKRIGTTTAQLHHCLRTLARFQCKIEVCWEIQSTEFGSFWGPRLTSNGKLCLKSYVWWHTYDCKWQSLAHKLHTNNQVFTIAIQSFFIPVAANEDWKPKWFTRIENGDEIIWRLKTGPGNYWEERCKGEWKDVVDVLKVDWHRDSKR